ncbi:hypothetical protein SAY86_008579 [Trapa natans]|uniref:Uncharacterized protein n=1 Tax=Trapa natans TaxID=22666 RepID=A0AAN7QAX5_TRANT|nr:hypothetical protein SAY86_008579 [Trapa natans]
MEDHGIPAADGNPGDIEISIVSAPTTHMHDHRRLPNGCNIVCPFSDREQGSPESEERSKSVKKLFGLMVFCAIIMVVEIFGGIKANSLAILSDAVHLLTDVTGLAISLFAAWASGWEPTSRHSFGFHRLEVLGAFVSVQIIWLISGVLIYEAVHRILHKSERVDGRLMFITATFGFLINLVMFMWVGHDHHHHPHSSCKHGDHHHHHHEHNNKVCNLANETQESEEEEETDLLSSSNEKTKRILNINLQGAYLHIMADLIQSMGVMIAGAVIWGAPRLLVVDLISTLIFSVLVVSTTVPLLRNIIGVLMERVPSEIDLSSLKDGLKSIKGVHHIHDLHVWSITVGKFVMSCHVVPEPSVSSSELLARIKDYCKRTCRIYHVTIQIE